MSAQIRESNGSGNASAHWDLDRIVTDLRVSRARAGQDCASGACEMPSREALRTILEGLCAALFPTHLGLPDLNDEGIDYFVGHTLDATLRSLHQQVQRELQFTAQQSAPGKDGLGGRALEMTRDFAALLPHVHALLESDIQAAYQGDPAAKSIQEVRLCYPGITAMLHHRLAHELYMLGAPLLARVIAELAHSATGIDIHPGAEIGDSFFIDHGTCVVIGETAIIGERVRIYQAVTLGAKSFPVGRDGELVKGIPRHPIVEDDVVIYAGATILGRITIGSGSVIGGNVWLTRSVPPGSNVTQVQARSEVFDGGGGI
jgi:serine O-acetyltransferase